MRVFLTGATGFIGRRLVYKLLQRDHAVTALVRRPEQASHLRALGVRVVPGDVTRPAGLVEAMRGNDWLLHLANHYSLHEHDERVFHAVNVQGNRNVMQAALDSGVSKVVHVSSVTSYGASPDQPLREDSRVGPHLSAYGRSKYLGDEVVWEYQRRGLPVVVVYPGVVVGRGDPNVSGQWVRRLARGRQVVRVFEAGRYTYVHVDDVAEAIVRAAERPGNEGQRYLIGREVLTHRDFVRLVCELSGTPPPPLLLPDALAHHAAALLGAVARFTRSRPLLSFSPAVARHLAEGFQYGSCKAERELGLRYTPVRQAVAEHVASLRSVLGR